MCEIIGVITEIVSNQYHLLVLIQKVIALQRLFNFLSQGKPIFAHFNGWKQASQMNIKPLFYNIYPQQLKVYRALRKKIDLKGKILQGLSSEKIYAFSAKISFASTFLWLFPLERQALISRDNMHW